MTASLRVRKLTAGYHGTVVLRDLDLDVDPGLTVIVGANGAGQTPLLTSLAGLISRQGDVCLDDQVLPPHDAGTAVRRGLALVAEGRQLFPQMTVHENLELGGWLLARAERRRRMARAFDDFPLLKQRAHQRAGTMSGGEQQMVAVARALVGAPRLLMLDEPS